MVIKLLLSGFFSSLAVSFAERYMLSVSTYRVKCKSLQDAPGRPIAVISDLHCCSFGKNNKRLTDRILSLDPCAVVIAGDLITGTKTKRQHVALELLRDLAGKVPVYYGFGNHERKAEDYRGESFYTAKVRGIKGVTLLKNDHADLSGSVRIYGYDEPAECYKRHGRVDSGMIERAIGKPDKDKFNILIAHDPEHFGAYVRWGADLVLAGHNHGGIVRLPLIGGVISPRRELFPKYDAGSFAKKKTRMLVSRGLGSHTIPIRVFNRPEIMLVYIE